MKIAMLVHNGVWKDARVLKEARTLAAAGHEIEVHGIDHSLQAGKEPFPVLLSSKMKVAASGFPLSGLFAIALRRVRRALNRPAKRPAQRNSTRLYAQTYLSISNALIASVRKRGTPDVIHIHDHVALTGAKALKGLFACPIVWDAHEIYEDLAASDPDRGALNREIIRENQAFVDHFITINESIAGFYAGKYQRLKDATIVMNATEVMPLPVDDGRLHQAAGLPPDQKILLFQGGFAEKRGLRELVQAASLLDARWTVVMMGWGNLEASLRALAAETAPSGRRHPAVVFLPGVPQRELQQWTAGATLGAIPYENTGLNHLYCTPNKLWEYPNAGVPILATALDEMKRIIEGAGTGFLLPREFAAKDIADIINAISDEQLQAARQACLKFTERDNWAIYETRLLALYDVVAKNAATRRRLPY